MGDFDQDRDADLAIGVPREDLRGVLDAGAVSVLDSAGRPGLAGADELVHQAMRGIKGAPEPGDQLGCAGIQDAGAVNVIHGGRGGLVETLDQWWTQDLPGVEGTVCTAWFGAGLAAVSPAG